MESILENFEKAMGINPINISQDKLSFENDVLSFRVTEPIKEEPVKEKKPKKPEKLSLSRAELLQVEHFLNTVRPYAERSHEGVDAFNEVVRALNKQDISRGAFIDLMNHLKTFMD